MAGFHNAVFLEVVTKSENSYVVGDPFFYLMELDLSGLSTSDLVAGFRC